MPFLEVPLLLNREFSYIIILAPPPGMYWTRPYYVQQPLHLSPHFFTISSILYFANFFLEFAVSFGIVLLTAFIACLTGVL